MPRRLLDNKTLEMPPLSAFAAQLKGSGERKISTTMAFVRILATLVRDKNIGSRVVPIVPDEARTFGMEGMVEPRVKTTPQNVQEANEALFRAKMTLPAAAKHCGMTHKEMKLTFWEFLKYNKPDYEIPENTITLPRR